MGASGVRGVACVVRDGNFFPGFDVTDRMDSFTLCLAIPTVMSIWETAVVDEANGRVNSPNNRTGATG
jgi:hypothetical protein